MIIDTTYLLPLSRIGVDTDLLKYIDEGKADINIADLSISSISVFELQAKAAKLGVKPNHTVEAIDVINATFRIEPFFNQEIVRLSWTLLADVKDYIDCIIIATAIAIGEDLVTEDSKIIDKRDFIKGRYKIDILNYKDFIKRYSL